MKLTQYHRDAIAESVLNDMPKLQDRNAAALELATKYVTSKLPSELRAIVTKYPEWTNKGYYSAPHGLSSMYLPCSSSDHRDLKKEPKLWAQLTALATAQRSMQEERSAIRIKVRAALNSVRTLAQAKETFPEFAKYFPEETDPGKTSRNLPAVIGLVDDLKRAGWPVKTKKKTS
jgi:hypothetical protein